MNNKRLAIISLLGILCVGIVAVFFGRSDLYRAPSTLRPSTEQTTKPEPTPTPTSSATSSTKYKDLIEITSPLPNTVISLSSPIVKIPITGKARGTWFFEGTFPIELVNMVGDTIATGVAHADGEWTTGEYVPFHSELTFSTTTDQTGNIGGLILKKDNPSGDPSTYDEFAIPVQFSP